MKELENKIKGALFGLAIGDAVGGTTEFLHPTAVKQKYGVVKDMLGGGAHKLAIGETTDDTAMTIGVARGIIKNPKAPIEDIGKEFLRWYKTMPKDVGITVSTSISNLKWTDDWYEAAYLTHQFSGGMSAGNGTLMRCLPVALAYKNRDKMDTITQCQSKMTHYDNLASEACLIYNRVVYRILEGENMKDALSAQLKGTKYEKSLTEEPDVLQTGFVGDTMNWVVYLLNNAKSYRDAILKATNNGMDSDTVAAIIGGVYGAEIGYDALPKEWKNKIILKKELSRLATKLTELRLA